MKSLIIYESFFGNTEKIAKEIGKILGATTKEVSTFELVDLADIELIVVGSPTRAFRPSPKTMEFLNKLPSRALSGKKVAAFDTGIEPKDIHKPAQRVILGGFVSIFGYAAKPIAEKLVKKGGLLVGTPTGFFVQGTEGPLRDGEIDRAVIFAKSLVC